MSYDVWFTANVGGDPENAPQLDSANYTSNVSGMWYEALGGITLGDLIEETPRAGDLLPRIREGIACMSEAPEHFREKNPPNGWGNYEGALDYLKWIAERCEAWPDSIVEVWR